MTLQTVPIQVGLPQGQAGQQVQFNNDQAGYWQSGFYIEHVATGLWFLANYGEEFVNSSGPYKDRPDHWYLKAGLRERWHPLGHSVVYGFYGQRDNMFDSGAVSGNTGMFNDDCDDGDCTVFKSRTEEWGGGFVQEIDAAAMSVWIQAEQFSATATACSEGIANGTCITEAGGEGGTVKSDLKDMTVVKFGGLINF